MNLHANHRQTSLHTSHQTTSDGEDLAHPALPVGEDLDLTDADRIHGLRQLLGASVCRKLGIYHIPPDFVLSVVVPVFNEVRTVATVLERIRHCGIPTEIIFVDDASTDGTRELIAQWPADPSLKILLHEKNQGKGAALKTGFEHATGQAVVVQDADLEYDPAEFRFLIQPIVEGDADVVFGSRFLGDRQAVLYFWHYVGNRALTTLSNCFTDLNLSDMETCYKVFRHDVIARIAPTLREKRFGIEPEITAKVASTPGIRIVERPVSYSGRTYAEGKKITWRDGISALRCIVRYWRGLR
jgi:glycosyltransferase involved in cell wall biosynthesis